MNIPIQQYWSLLARYLKPQWRQVLGLAWLLTAITTAQLVNPQIVRTFIDTAESHSPSAQLLQAAALFMGIAILEQLLLIAATYLSEQIGWTATNRLREALAHHCLQLNMHFHHTHTPGEMIERIDGDVNNLANFFSQFTLVLVSNLLLLIGVLTLLWWEDWRIGLTITIISITGLLALNYVRTIAVPYWQAVRQASAELFGFLEERLNGKEDIRANDTTAYVLHRLHNLLRQQFEQELQVKKLNVFSVAVPLTVFGLAYMAAFALSDAIRTLSVGTVYLIFHYLLVLESPLWQIVNEVKTLQQAGASIGRIEELNQLTNPIQDGPGHTLPPGPLSVHFDQVSFRYATQGETILENIDFFLPPGQTVGLLGRTGSGKTTLTRLLTRLYDPTAGQINLNAIDIRQMTLRHLRHQVGIVPQQVQLFHGTVRDNLTFFDETVSTKRLTAVIHELGLQPWLARLPEGLDTHLMAGGYGLSAGEAQLLAFMRVFLQNPGLVILDEASSRLDAATESLIQRAIQTLLHNRTGIIIAHRLQTLQWVDQIMVLENGRILEYGPRQTLATDPHSHFYQRLQTGLDPWTIGASRHDI